MKVLCARCGKIHEVNQCDATARKHRYTESRKLRSSGTWKRVRKQALDRDYVCRLCLLEGRVTTNNLVVHHITPVNEDNSKAYDIGNLITLCDDCHHKLHSNYTDDLKELCRKLTHEIPTL